MQMHKSTKEAIDKRTVNTWETFKLLFMKVWIYHTWALLYSGFFLDTYTLWRSDTVTVNHKYKCLLIPNLLRKLEWDVSPVSKTFPPKVSISHWLITRFRIESQKSKLNIVSISETCFHPLSVSI